MDIKITFFFFEVIFLQKMNHLNGFFIESSCQTEKKRKALNEVIIHRSPHK